MKSISTEELEATLKAHQNWLATEARQGCRANLAKHDLRGLMLQGVDLREADLEGADLTGADLRGVDFQGADLRDAWLFETNLEEADLSTAKGLVCQQFGGANVARARLPEPVSTFAGLAHVNQISKNTARVVLLVVLVCFYVVLTIAATTDARLLANSTLTPLPIVQTQIALVHFYWVAPLLVLSFYILLLEIGTMGLTWRGLETSSRFG